MKKVLSFVCVSVLALSIVACTKKKAEETMPTAAPAAAPAEQAPAAAPAEQAPAAAPAEQAPEKK